MENKKTLYHQLINFLRREIQLMNIGDKLPSERQLCEDYQVSRTTVRNAISDLELNGLVKRIQGKGTFVHNPSVNRQNLSDYYSFTEQTKKLGKIPSSEILEYHIEQANSMIAEKLDIAENDLIIRFIRLRKANNVPMMYETTFIPYVNFSDITKNLLEQLPLYDIFEHTYHRKIHKVTEIFSVSTLNRIQAHTLRLSAKDPCLKITRVSFDESNHIIEYTISLARGDQFNYQTTYFPK